VIIDCALYVDGRRAHEGRLSLDQIDPEQIRQKPGAYVWLGLKDPSTAELGDAEQVFHLHPLAVEDALEARQRPKLEVYGDSIFFVMKTAQYFEDTEKVSYGELLVFVGDWFIVVVRHGEANELREVRAHMEANPEMLAGGPGAVLHEICDRVIDNYDVVLDAVDQDVVEVEGEVFSDTKNDPTERIYRLKREALVLHGAIEPLLDALDTFVEAVLPQIEESHRPYFRDLRDHLLRANQKAEGIRELLTNVLQANLSRIQVQQNIDMRKISAWVAIFVAPTLIAGIYGMNFENMPELHHRSGYFIVLGSMVGLMALIYGLLRRAKWL